MTADIIAWLRSEEGEEWSRSRGQCPFYGGQAPSPVKDPGPVDAAEDPTGRPPVKGPALIAAAETAATGEAG